MNEQIVDNTKADDVVTAVKNGKTDVIPRLMDLVAGVADYDISNTRRQGCIGRIYVKETNRHVNPINIIDINDVVSTFWENVFKHIGDAVTTGSIVTVRLVDGQDGVAEQNMSRPGLAKASRVTKCNPICYLRNVGIMSIRNLLNKTYRHNIIYKCANCDSSAIHTNELQTTCPACESTNTIKIWPSGHSSYGSKKYRKCSICGHQWQRKFFRACRICKSTELHTESRYQNNDAVVMAMQTASLSADRQLMDYESGKELNRLISDIIKAMPRNHIDNKESKTAELIRVLTNPDVGREVCNLCKRMATKVCAMGCAMPCSHPTIPDPKITCGADEFDISRCLNYSKKLGQYQECSPSLIARRIQKARKFISRYMQQYDSELCLTILKFM